MKSEETMKQTSLIMSKIPIVLMIILLSALVPQTGASIFPTMLEATLSPGESIIENKIVEITEVPPKADVLFSFDLTSSMAGIIDTAKSQSSNIMTSLDGTGSDINYGVASYMDYPNYYSSFDYSNPYGASWVGDYAYRLGSPITNDRTAVSNAINTLNLGGGEDSPEDYTRIMYESYADPAVSWRAGAKKILLNFGDDIPHDNNLYEGVFGYSGVYSTGGDPGRNEIMDETSDPTKIGIGNDDLDLQTVLAGMASNNIILLESHTAVSGFALDGWTYWTSITGGKLFTTSSSTLPGDVVAEVTKALTASTVDNVHLVASSGYESWISSPDSYTGPTGVSQPFALTITVPEGTPAGEYKFKISAIDSSGVSYGDQDVSITVNDNVAPEVTLDTPYFVKVPITLLIGGQGMVGNSVALEIIQDGETIASDKISRAPGSPKEQEVTVSATIDLSKPYSGRLVFDTETAYSGGTPVWIIIDGAKTKITAFNTQKNDPSSYHQTYDFEIAGLFSIIGKEITFTGTANDPEDDDLTFDWTFGDGGTSNTFYPWSGSHTVIDIVKHTYTAAGSYDVTVAVMDDDGDVQAINRTISVY